MKKALTLIFSIFTVCLVRAEPSSIDRFPIYPGVTNMAANTTNSTEGRIITMPQNGVARTLFIMGRAEGVAATTNVVSSGSNIVFKIKVSIDGTNFSNGPSSAYKVTIPAPGYTTNYHGDWFYLPGIKAIRVGPVENNTGGASSNLYLEGSFHY